MHRTVDLCSPSPRSGRRDDRPLANTYWVDPGRFAAAEYPGAWDRGEAAARLRTLLQAGIDCFIDLTQRDEGLEPVYVHCWGGIGRTGTVVGCWLVRHGMTGDEALAEFASPGRWFNRPCCSRWAGAT